MVSPCVVAAITSKEKPHQPTHIPIGKECGLSQDSYLMLEQIRTIDKCRLIDYIGRMDDEKMDMVNKILAFSLGINNKGDKNEYNHSKHSK